MKKRLLFQIWLLCCLMTIPARPLPAEENPTQGCLFAQNSKGEILGDFPLKHTDVKAEISGFAAQVTVTQTFQNPYADKIEAVYVFPLPQNAAVNDFIMKVGGRTIHGLIKTREDARKIYEDAKTAGHVASLLEQERPNIFTQSVANIEPGKQIQITLRYVERLEYDHGVYEFVFPMVVGPRYIPGQNLNQPDQGQGWSHDTNLVPDASRITPPYLRPGERNGHDISLSVDLDAGVSVQDLTSPSHDIETKTLSENRAFVLMSPKDNIPNKDFVLRYKVAGVKPQMALIAHRGLEDKYGYFTLMIQPQADFTAQEITPKEMIFVVDCSGSMMGEPIAKAKQLMRHALKNMGPGDSFQIIRFSDTSSGLANRPLENTPENIRTALSFINGLNSEGGTEMLSGIKAALDYPHDPKRLRIVCFLTDGYIGNESQILAAIQDKIADARLFSFGVGSSVNRYLLDQMAKAGRGTTQYVRPDEDTDRSVNLFYERIAHPFLTDIKIDWGQLAVEDLYPGQIPDLFIGQPVFIHGRYKKAGSETVKLRGKVAGKEMTYELSVTLPERQIYHETMASLWAKMHIQELEGQLFHGEDKDVVREITQTGLQFRLMTAYTSFVAVEEKTVTEGGQARTVQVPVEMPEGTSWKGVFGNEGLLSREAEYAPAGGRLACQTAVPMTVRSKTVHADYSLAKRAEETMPDEKKESANALNFEIAWVSYRQGHRIERKIESDGEVWETEYDASQKLLHRTLIRKLTVSEYKEMVKILKTVSQTETLSESILQGAWEYLTVQENGNAKYLALKDPVSRSAELSRLLNYF
jgi:Ca-activated chloride channel family protein